MDYSAGIVEIWGFFDHFAFSLVCFLLRAWFGHRESHTRMCKLSGEGIDALDRFLTFQENI